MLVQKYWSLLQSCAALLRFHKSFMQNSNLWWVVVLKGPIIQLSLMPVSSQYLERQMIPERDGELGGTPQASGHSAVRRQMQRLVKNPLKAKYLHARRLLHTVLREEGNVVREDPSVQGELCELLLQILTGLWTASWNMKPAVVISKISVVVRALRWCLLQENW